MVGIVQNSEDCFVDETAQTISEEQRLAWFVIQTKPNLELEVKARLIQAGLHVLYPRIKTFIKRKSGWTERLRSLFPSYIFVQINLDTTEIFHMLKYTRGVNKVLGIGDKPRPIPDKMIEIIIERLDKQDVLDQKQTLQKGDKVRLTKGPLQDLVGILEKPISSAGRVRVLLEVMNKVVRVETTCHDIERL